MKTIWLTTILALATLINLNAQCVEGDCKNGTGTIVYKSGNKYQGAFQDGKKHGYGKFIWVSGARYKGDWFNNKRHGEGTELLRDGSKYVGGFYNDVKHGQGVEYASNGSIMREGEWTNGTFSRSTGGDISQNTGRTKSKSGTGLKKANFDRYINVGVGLGSFYGSGLSYSDVSVSRIPPVSLSIDLKEIKKNIKLGAFIGYTSYKLSWANDFYGNYGWRTSFTILGARGTYSFNLFDDPMIDTYAGVMLGYNIASVKYFGDDIFANSVQATANSISYSGFIGMRYMFTPKMGAFAELGYGISYLTVGFTSKF